MKKWIVTGITVIFILIIAVLTIYFNALTPVKTAEKEALENVKQQSDLTTVDHFSLFNGTESYYIFEGTDSKKQAIVVWVDAKTKKVTSILQKDGITRKEAENILLQKKNPTKIETVRLAMVNGTPAWEIYYRSEGDLINYYYIDFKTGKKELRVMENL